VTAAHTRHRLLQGLLWHGLGPPLVRSMMRFGRKFDVVVRNYSLIGATNGERWLAGLMDDAPCVVDVGFHDGDSTLEILKARPKATVFAFDPSRFAAEQFEKRFKDQRSVTFANVGLSSAPGALTFYDYDNMCNSLAPRKEMAGAADRVYTVPITTLDAYCAQAAINNINFMKVDAEGYDLNVLEGAKDLFERQSIDMFMFEFASGWASTKRYLWEARDYFEPLPYRLFRLFNGFLAPLKYRVEIDSCTTLSAMYVGVSEKRLARGDIPVRDLGF
jgi:FkbM family methyltransferase